MGSPPPEDVDAHLLNSKYRQRVLGYLVESGASTPKETAEAVDLRRSHVSRAIGELRERDLVELTVPESRSVGRYYEVTADGRAAWSRIRDRSRRVPWSVRDPEADWEHALVASSRDAAGESLRSVCRYDGEEVVFLYLEEHVRAQYSEGELTRTVGSFVLDHDLLSLEPPDRSVTAETLTFQEFTVVCVDADGGPPVAVSFDNGGAVRIPAFVETVVDDLRTA